MDLLASNSDIQTLNTYSGSDLCHRIQRTSTTISRSAHRHHSYVNDRKTDRPVKSLALRQNECLLPPSSSVEALELTEYREDDGAREGALCSSGCSVIFGKRLRPPFGDPREGWIILNKAVALNALEIVAVIEQYSDLVILIERPWYIIYILHVHIKQTTYIHDDFQACHCHNQYLFLSWST